ncbi:MAG: aminopeptidase P family protein [Clostridia bacterium]|nr:aminopeptidase P family protein [Clostridia bacterium]
MNTNRINRVIENMKAEGLSQILVSTPASVFYLIGSKIGPGERMLALLIRDDGTVILHGNRLFALNGNVSVPLVEHDDTDDCIAVLSRDILPGKLGIDNFWQSRFTIRLMEARPDVRPVLGSGPVDKARMEKGEDEIERMRAASRLNDQVLERTMAQLREGMTEAEVGAVYTSIAKELGAQGCSFPPLICFGANCAEPHHGTDETVLRKGDSIILDVGVKLGDYCADMTRTVFFGEPTEEMVRVYNLVKAANEAGRAAVRPGEPMKNFDRAARKVIEDGGYGPYFTHRTGHGIGLEVHEYPDNSAASEIIAQPGMTFSVEPGIYLPGRFGVRVEDLVAVTETGCETLNALDREIKVIG